MNICALFLISLVPISSFDIETPSQARQRREKENIQSLENKTPQTAIDDLGINIGEPITNGFLFIDGRYIHPPYVIKREGNGILVNGQLLEKRIQWPSYKPKLLGSVPEMPEMPTTITEKSSQYDDDVILYTGIAMAYFEQKYGKWEMVKRMVDVFRSLPCVEDARIPEDGDGTSLIITWKNDDNLGGNVHTRLIAPVSGRKPIEWTNEKIIQYLEKRKEYYETGLSKGRYYFTAVRAAGKIAGSQEGAIKTIGALISILETSETPEEVYQRMRASGTISFLTVEQAKHFFENRDSITPELKQRIETLRVEQEAKRNR